MANNQELQRREHSTGLIAILTNTDNPDLAKDFERGLTIHKIIETAIPICEVRKETGLKAISQALDIQLTKLVASLNLKWNLSDAQIGIIVEELIYKYPNESLEDFILVFRRARHGEFGELYRLDSAVIFSWMQIHLDEKYAVIENKLLSEKDNIYKVELPTCGPEDPAMKWIKKWKAYIDALKVKKVPQLTDADIKKEGQEKLVKKIHPSTSQAELDRHDIHLLYCRENYDLLTADPLPTWKPESEWIKDNEKEIKEWLNTLNK